MGVHCGPEGVRTVHKDFASIGLYSTYILLCNPLPPTRSTSPSLSNEQRSPGPRHQTKFIPARDAQIQKPKATDSIGRRRKLVFPNAQVGEAELEEIIEIGQTGENANSLVSGGSKVSSKLFGEYDELESAKMARTPRTTPQRRFDLHTFGLRTTLWLGTPCAT